MNVWWFLYAASFFFESVYFLPFSVWLWLGRGRWGVMGAVVVGGLRDLVSTRGGGASCVAMVLIVWVRSILNRRVSLESGWGLWAYRLLVLLVFWYVDRYGYSLWWDGLALGLMYMVEWRGRR